MRAVVRVALCLGITAVAIGDRAAAQATPSGATRIGFVNAQALLRGMPGYAQAESTFAKEATAAESEAQKLQSQWDSTVAQFQQSQAMMTPSNRTARERQLSAQADSLQAKLQAIQSRIRAKESELLNPIQERLRAVIDGIRAEGNYALIIDLGSQTAAGIIAYDKSLDITMRVAQRLAADPSS